MNTFDASTHTYRIGGKTVPSVTQVLDEVGWVDKSWFTPEGTARGTKVHEILAASDHGMEVTFDAELEGYVRAWETFRRFITAFGGVEVQMYSKTYGLAGTIDRVRQNIITEIKTGAPMWWHVYQLGGYQLLLNENGNPGSYSGECVYLSKDGSFRVTFYTAAEILRAKRIFQAALTCVSVARAERK